MTFKEDLEAYLNEELAGAERQAFEARLATDPLLQQEFELQRDMREALAEQRRQQLKRRLRGVEVAAPTSSNPLAALRFAGYAVVAAIIVLIGVFMLNQQENTEAPGPVAVAPAEPVAPVSVPEKPKAKTKAFREAENEELVIQPKSREEMLALRESAKPVKRRQMEVVAAAPVAPGDEANNSVEPADKADVTAPKDGVINTITSSKTDVAIRKDDRYDFHYQYSGSKLYLYGEFEGKLYEVLDLNSRNGKQLFLFFSSKYYHLKPSTDVVKLAEVEDKNLVNELEALRRKKLD